MTSPRIVTVVDRWAYDYRCGMDAFPSGVFAGGNCGVDHAKVTPSITIANARRKAASQGPWCKPKQAPKQTPSFTFPFLDLSTNKRNHGQTKLAPRPRLLGRTDGPPHSSVDTSRSRSLRETIHKAQAAIFTDEGGIPNAFGVRDSSMKTRKISVGRIAEAAQNGENLSVSTVAAGKPTRSRAIAIKRNRETNADEDDEPRCASTERMYDWATWRMYTRITDHRRRYPLKHPYTHDSISASGGDHDERNKDGARKNASGHALDLTSGHHEHFFDGEVFELEI